MKRFRIFLLLFLTTLSAVANEYDLMIQRLSNTGNPGSRRKSVSGN